MAEKPLFVRRHERRDPKSEMELAAAAARVLNRRPCAVGALDPYSGALAAAARRLLAFNRQPVWPAPIAGTGRGSGVRRVLDVLVPGADFAATVRRRIPEDRSTMDKCLTEPLQPTRAAEPHGKRDASRVGPRG